MNCWTGWRLSKRVGLGRKTAYCLRQADRKNLDFFVVTPNGNLLLDEERVSYECYCLGYFGLVGNVDIYKKTG